MYRAVTSQSSAPQHANWLLVIFSTLLVLALYINLAKVILGSRYFVLLADAAVLALSLWVVVARVLGTRPFTWVETLTSFLLMAGLLQLFNPNVPSFVAGAEGYRRIMFQMLAVFIGVAAVRKRGDVVFLGKVLAVASVPILLYSIKQFFSMSNLDYAIMESNTAAFDTWRIFGKVRAFAIFNGPFHLGIFSGFIFWIATAIYLETKKKLLIALALVAVLACLASLTRSSIIALFVSFPIALCYAYRRYRMRVIWATALVVAGTLLTAHFLRTNYKELDFLMESISSLQSIREDSRLGTRFEQYDEAFSTLKSHPFGTGMGSAGDAMEHYFEPYSRIHITSHNLFLRVALETGWLGLLLFLGIIGCILASVRTLKRSGDRVAAIMLLGPLMVVLITGITGSTAGAYPANLLFWSLCGVLVGLASTTKGPMRSV